MADVNISKYRASVVRDGSKPASPGFVVSEGQDPVDPAGTGQNHLPVTIATEATGFSITDSQVLGGAGTVSQYIRGDGSLADFPESSGGGSSVSYYLNGSVAQGTIGGVAYKELNKVPILGAGTDFSINADGYIASFLTDAGDPNLLEIPGGNWNFETYFSSSSSGGTPTFYVELYKYDGTTFTLIASNSSSPEFIAFGTTLTAYFSTLAVPTTTLALTDRLAVRYYVTHSGRTITLHTEDNHLCQIVTTFTTGLTALNGLTAQVQNFAVGTTGTDFNIASATATHTFNLPTASATNRGALSSADWTTFNNKMPAITFNAPLFIASGGSVGITQASGSTNGFLSSTDWTTFNNKQNALTNPVTGTGTNNYLPKFTGLTTIGDSVIADNTNEVNISKRIFLNSGGQSIFFTPNLSGVSNRIEGSSGIPLEIFTGGSALRLGAGGSSTQINLASTGVVTISNLAGTGSRIVVADSSGNLSASSALSGYVQGLGTTNYLPKFTGASTIGNSQVFDNGTFVGIGTGGSSIGNDFVSVFFNSSTARSQAINIKDTNASANGSTFEVYRKSDDTYLGNIRRNGTDNAIYVGGNSYLALGANNTEFVRINSSGNLLVGTTTDNGEKLQVNGEITAVTRIRINKTTQSNQIFGDGNAFNISGSNNLGIRNDSGSIVFASGGATVQMLLNTSGNVGIGTSSPQVRLDFGNSLDQAFHLYSSGSDYYGINMRQYDSGPYSTNIFSGDGGQIKFRTASGTTTQSTRMTITATGNVGIGTTSPAVNLHIKGSSAYSGIRIDNTGTTGGGYTAYYQNNIQTGIIGVSGAWYGNTDNNLAIAADTGKNIIFFTDGTATPKATITSGGNVLIGTTTDAGNGILQVNKSTSNAVARFTNARNTSGDFGIVTDLGSNCNNTSSYHYIAGTGGADKFYLYGNGTYATVSDRRLKKNIESVTEQFLEKVLALDIVTYNWNDQKDGSDLELGMIAQQVETAFPSIVKTNRPDLSGQTYKSIQASALPYILIKAIQELKQEIDTLKN